MRHPSKRTRSALTAIQGDSPLSGEEIAALRLQAWQEQLLLIVSPSDPNLTGDETAFLFELGERLYGAESEGT